MPKQKEALYLMKYRCSECGFEDRIWNSRDGVTPFTVNCPKCKAEVMGAMSHVDWAEDRYLPDHKPKPGDRIFIDLTVEAYRESIEKRVEAWWDNSKPPMKEHFDTKEAAIESLMCDFQPGQPNIITVEAKQTPSMYSPEVDALAAKQLGLVDGTHRMTFVANEFDFVYDRLPIEEMRETDPYCFCDGGELVEEVERIFGKSTREVKMPPGFRLVGMTPNEGLTDKTRVYGIVDLSSEGLK